MKPAFEKYIDFTEEQFAADEYFQQFVLYPEPGHLKFWKEFLNRYPGSEPCIENARRILHSISTTSDPAQSLTISEKEQMRLSIMANLDLPLSTGYPENKKQFPVFRWISVAAAAILAAVFILPLFNPKTKQVKNEIYSWHNNTDEKKEIMLADSSLVILNAQSTLTVTGNLAHATTREVSIEGNGFFKVRKLNGHIPFLVHTQDASITVLGTMFDVNTRNGAAEIALTEGAVKVTHNTGPSSTAFLQPGEKTRWDSASQKFLKSEIDIRLYNAWTDGQWHFTSTTLSEVASLIHAYYGKEVEFASAKTSESRITAVIPAADIHVLGKVLAKTFHLDIRIENNRVYIQ